ncbi:DUF427 domain-containing protein [Anderseniella sp. Alg231-50]|uniref:DUF427 domain-containing protein n=1 Tax=Anderseniella sp. Alg231-50 TaxID=1922226 RepID=UPI000D5514E8
MAHPQITLATATIHNPDEPRHFMRIKPVHSRVHIRLGDTVLADSCNAIRLLEVGTDFYDPMIYLPPQDIAVTLAPVAGRTSRCPLKGEASYWSFAGWTPKDAKDYLAWSYAEPFGFARDLAGLIAFNPAHVAIEEMPG